ncbi:transport protein particle component, partial [Aaosphaeria arxii CBS 175.79]
PSDPTGSTYHDPTSTLVNASTLDFLLIELVPLAYRITEDLARREEHWLLDSGDSASSAVGTTGAGAKDTATATVVVDEEEAREAVFHRLETLGYRVGLGVVERFSRSTPRPTTPLDVIKFLCKDLWQLLFRKQIDNLKTNHRGIYVLTDNTFKPLSRVSFDTKKYPPGTVTSPTPPTSSSTGGAAGGGAVQGDVVLNDANGLARAQPFLYFPAGVIRGCLAGLGIQATVTAEATTLPMATFQIRTVGAK